ncbi:MAG: restriction endonuclease subunit S [Lachnospiraceae bacterium]|nr:restriction endonuclease subunit S [Lachnospiraceae bacterium]
MIDTEKLRSRILSLAMKGELSERIESDGDAKELYSRILTTKSELVKKGEIRKDKKYDELDPEQTPFQLPDTWTWVRFGKIINLQSGQDLSPSDYNAEHKGIPYITGASNYSDDGSIIINRWTESPKAFARKNDILLSCKGTVGKLAILQEDEVHIARQIMGIRAFEVSVEFMFYYLQSMIYGIKEAQKGLIPGIERNDVLDLLCPLPPVLEQERIVKKVRFLFSELDTIDGLQSQYISDAEVLKGKLIDAAIQGKLTKQIESDGNAEDLLTRITNEKKELIKSGKIPKEKRLPAVSDKEIPFEIPSSWRWVRVQDVASYITDYVANGSFATLKAHTKTYKEPNYALFVRTMDLSSGFKEGCSYIDKASYDFLEKSRLFGGELILPNIGASIGKAFIMPDMKMPMSLAPNSILLKFIEPVMNEYFSFVVKSTYGGKLLNKTQGGSATAKFSKTDLRSLVVPLPPLNEIKRIVDTLNRMNAILE